MSRATKVKHSGYAHGSQYEVILRALEEEGTLDEPMLNPSSSPEDLNSRTLFPDEPSREPTIYSTVYYQANLLPQI